jgi:transcriptional regulator with XRE-family HTH domain
MATRKKDPAPVGGEGPDDFLGPFIGKILLRARKARNITQEDLARKVGVNDGTLRRIEGGLGVRPAYVQLICEALGLDHEEVVTEALLRLWLSFSSTAAARRPLRLLRENFMGKLDTYQKAQRELVEAYLDFESFVHFKTKWEDAVPS